MEGEGGIKEGAVWGEGERVGNRGRLDWGRGGGLSRRWEGSEKFFLCLQEEGVIKVVLLLGPGLLERVGDRLVLPPDGRESRSIGSPFFLLLILLGVVYTILTTRRAFHILILQGRVRKEEMEMRGRKERSRGRGEGKRMMGGRGR